MPLILSLHAFSISDPGRRRFLSPTRQRQFSPAPDSARLVASAMPYMRVPLPAPVVCRDRSSDFSQSSENE